jgi:hypothetical protein
MMYALNSRQEYTIASGIPEHAFSIKNIKTATWM